MRRAFLNLGNWREPPWRRAEVPGASCGAAQPAEAPAEEHSADVPGRDPRTGPKGGCISVWCVGNVRSFSVRRLLVKWRTCREGRWPRVTCPVLRAVLLSLRNLMILLRRTASWLRSEHWAGGGYNGRLLRAKHSVPRQPWRRS